MGVTERSVTRSLRCVNSVAWLLVCCVVGRGFGRSDSGHAITDLSGHSGRGYDRGVVAMGLGCRVFVVRVPARGACVNAR